jgi:hypothetical protein
MAMDRDKWRIITGWSMLELSCRTRRRRGSPSRFSNRSYYCNGKHFLLFIPKK